MGSEEGLVYNKLKQQEKVCLINLEYLESQINAIDEQIENLQIEYNTFTNNSDEVEAEDGTKDDKLNLMKIDPLSDIKDLDDAKKVNSKPLPLNPTKTFQDNLKDMVMGTFVPTEEDEEEEDNDGL